MSSASSHAAGLNDTGIIDCYNDDGVGSIVIIAGDKDTHPRQDCRYGRDAQAAAGLLIKIGGGAKGFDFSKIANDGTALPVTVPLGSGPKDWGCTRDNVTNLIWEIKTDNGLRDKRHTYTWYNSNSSTNGGTAGVASRGSCAINGRCDTEKFTADVNTLGMCGAKDWRMPTIVELESLADYGDIKSVYGDVNYFPNTADSALWSGSPAAGTSRFGERAWLFSWFSSGPFYRSQARAVRLVRSVK
jgi:hypothetical protein